MTNYNKYKLMRNKNKKNMKMCHHFMIIITIENSKNR